MALRAGMCTALTSEMHSKLVGFGISSVSDFIYWEPEVLSREIKVSYKDICSIRHMLLAEYSAYPVSALDLYQSAMSSLTILSTACSDIDKLLDGGLYTGELTELAGDTCTGKSRFCHWCAASTVRTDNQSVLYIDSGGSFDVSILLEAISSHSHVEDDVHHQLCRVKHMQVFSIYELFDALEKITVALNDTSELAEWCGLKLVVVDNLAMLLNPFHGANAAYNQGLISRLGLKLKKLADTFSVAVLTTNNLVSSYNNSFQEDQHRKPALGKVWSHAPQTRVVFNRVGASRSSFPRPSVVEASLVKSQRQETPSSVSFSLEKADFGTID